MAILSALVGLTGGTWRPAPASISFVSCESQLAQPNRNFFERRNPMKQTLLRPSGYLCFVTFLVATAGMLLALNTANAQRKATGQTATDESPLFQAYRGIQLGMATDEVRKKLGDPKDKGDEQDFFVFNDTETAQIVYDKMHKVVTISADFLAPGTDVPTAKQVFGSEVEAKADGSIYKMVRFTKAGYWLSYNRTSGASPLTTVTLQKIQ
jgi:hypothetical protein